MFKFQRYPDPTACKAEKNISAEEKRKNELIYICGNCPGRCPLDKSPERRSGEAEQCRSAISKSKSWLLYDAIICEAMENAQTDETKAAFEAKYQKKAALLQQQNKAYNQYCEDTGLKKQSDRITIAKWDRSQAAKATAAARKYNECFPEKTSAKVFTNQNSPGIINVRVGNEKMTINSIEKPIEQKHTGKGNPNAILHFDVELTKRQAAILDNLPGYNSRTVVTKSNVNMADLSALTAKTGDEFALFTKSGERLIVRGNPVYGRYYSRRSTQNGAGRLYLEWTYAPGSGIQCAPAVNGGLCNIKSIQARKLGNI